MILIVLLFTPHTQDSLIAQDTPPAGELDRTVTQWWPYLEWRVEAPSVVESFFDVIATVTFTHTTSGEVRQTQMFYDGGTTWVFRFTGTQTGEWTFTSSSTVPELDGLNGIVTVEPNPNPNEPGFVTHIGNKWAHTGTGEVFVPQYVMGGGPQYYYEDLNRITQDIDLFLEDHGFNGIHVLVLCRWFDINAPTCDNATPETPDLRTFVALETLVSQVYQAGGTVHIWVWGDDDRGQNPNTTWGQNSIPDKRLQRYIAARLGPLPGWTLGYGFDLFEWTTPEQIEEWHTYMHEHLGWDHYLGGRGYKEELREISPQMDYASYEKSRPDYDWYLQAIGLHADRPVFAEDRYRVQFTGGSRDFTEKESRRLMWYSMMVGGVANIWGYLGYPDDTTANSGGATSLPYPNKEQIQTHFRFWEDRFFVDMTPCNTLTDGACLGSMQNQYFVFYKDDADSITLDLSALPQGLQAVAVDTQMPYVEFDLGMLPPENQIWHAPYISDWALAVGQFEAPVIEVPDAQPEPAPTATPQPVETPLPLDVQFAELQASVDPAALVLPRLSWRLVSPGELTEQTEAAVWYNILIVDAETNILLDTWVEAASICVDGDCTFMPDPQAGDLPAGLADGEYRWFLRLAVDERVSTWVEGTPVYIDMPAPQLPQDFSVRYVGTQTVITWVDDPNAAFYEVYLVMANGTPHYQGWQSRSQLVCDGTRCTFADELPAGSYGVYVRSWGAGGFSAGGLGDGWNGITFDLLPPGMVHDLAYNAGALNWTSAAVATYYQLWIGRDDTTWHQAWYSADALGCPAADMPCTLALQPPAGTYEWFVQPWGPGGYALEGQDGWQAGPVFTVSD